MKKQAPAIISLEPIVVTQDVSWHDGKQMQYEVAKRQASCRIASTEDDILFRVWFDGIPQAGIPLTQGFARVFHLVLCGEPSFDPTHLCIEAYRLPGNPDLGPEHAALVGRFEGELTMEGLIVAHMVDVAVSFTNDLRQGVTVYSGTRTRDARKASKEAMEVNNG